MKQVKGRLEKDERYELVCHPIPPVYDKNSRVLVLGSFPSVKSREQAFFYGHPQNRFWKVVSTIGNKPIPNSVEEKKELLLSLGIAVWDVIASCKIIGSSDNSIRDVKPNDLSVILNNSKVKSIFVNGKTAKKYYDKYVLPTIGIDAVCLPSTSPANATYNLDKLTEDWARLVEKK
ncbi:MAG: DNA-deoxyinosine glycosylase [Clostridia bacterium]|nr:DNA-deoxyinosine glycosylase [Clostridia bacterium]